jgi:Zn-dependent protease with chaperone function
VPPELVAPSRSFRLRAWAAVAGLALFLLLYFGLAAWFARAAVNSVRVVDSSGDITPVLVKGLPALFFFALMVKGVFFVRRGGRDDLLEVREADEPLLHRFVQRVAADAGGPRPHRVFVSARVNAAVFYDVSLVNLLFPTRKNLELGLGLVNTLSLDELKAVVAHEYGHFAQRTMGVGAWVYIARQFAGTLVARRDGFDRFLLGVSNIDARFAWIGWLMRLVVWALRAIVDTGFRGLVALERALSRQMEFQADLVSVSVSGSDSLIHALHRLGAAERAWRRAITVATGETNQGRPVADLFALQTRVIERMAAILDEPDHGRTPPLPDEGRARHRLFRSGVAEVPRMWETHPPNHEREENAKRVYLPSTFDARASWILFRDPETLRRRATRKLLEQMEVPEETLAASAPPEESLAAVDKMFDRPRYDARYRGAFLFDDLTRHATSVKELYDTLPEDDGAIRAALGRAYPETLRRTLRERADLDEEYALLEGLNEGFLAAQGGVIRFRGRELRRRQLPGILAEVKRELEAASGAVWAHDRAVRTAHRAAAHRLGRGWEAHLVGLLRLVHYAEHTRAALADVHGFVLHVVAVVTANGKVSESDMKWLMTEASQAQRQLVGVLSEAGHVRLPAPIADELEARTLDNLLGKVTLGAPLPEDLARGWLSAMAEGFDHVRSCLGRLRGAALGACRA